MLVGLSGFLQVSQGITAEGLPLDARFSIPQAIFLGRCRPENIGVRGKIADSALSVKA
jgi:hypothetical protein